MRAVPKNVVIPAKAGTQTAFNDLSAEALATVAAGHSVLNSQPLLTCMGPGLRRDDEPREMGSIGVTRQMFVGSQPSAQLRNTA